jgi:hypothetical protein
MLPSTPRLFLLASTRSFLLVPFLAPLLPCFLPPWRPPDLGPADPADGQEPRTISLSKLSASAILQELYTATGLASEEGSKPTPIGAELAEAARTVPPETSG